MSRFSHILATATAVVALATPAGLCAQDIAITNATVATGDGSEPMEGATVVVRSGKVVAAGRGVTVPAGMQTVDGTGKWVTPGIFAAATTLGLWDVGAVSESNDLTAGNSPFSAALDIAPALNPSSQHVAVSRAGGVTRASIVSAPASSIFGGQGAIVDLGADPDMVVRPRAFQMVALGEYGARLAGGSRTSAHALLRNALREARDVGSGEMIPGGRAARGAPRQGDDLGPDNRMARNETDRGSDVLLTRFDAAALVPVLDGTQPLYVVVERAADIRAVLALRNEFPALDLVLAGVSEGWLVASEIAAAGVPVIADPLDDLPSSFEQLAATQSNVGRMVAAGVKVAIGRLGNGIEQPRNSPQYAGNLVALGKIPGASGLSWGQALATITSVPAEIAGYGGQFGVLATGAAGDIVIWDGDPLELSSAPTAVYIDGVLQPVSNHQTRLRERYRDLDESDLPKAYDW
ncbi:hypothetical protein HME9302_02462 [Alteripontixanthobacter maritimus]|uniref:Amidohydrolase-related domain-containing protein n=1 Tax=Alteripontixanthobacter maritimus TaxID=2161824 RepID=A0A369Q9U0_9SPHN|nr:amidohydrolase family protein [Alteripontixanthobacter maritimus]RDC61242.1 hypothetical protein HME9302_02462 [Alteripontixanthobacter maritimus]